MKKIDRYAGPLLCERIYAFDMLILLYLSVSQTNYAMSGRRYFRIMRYDDESGS